MTDDRPATDVPAHAGAPEIWSLDHPEHGVLEFAVGTPAELKTIDPGYPQRKPLEKAASPASASPVAASPVAASPPAAPSAAASPGCALLRDGEVVARARQISDRRFSLTADPPPPGEHTTAPPLAGPRVQVRTNLLDTAVRQVTFRGGRDVVHFDPPPGSAAEARLEAIASSPWKRVVYPVAAGIGRSGWAIAMILLLPVIGRLLDPVLDWILERLADIPWPSIPWPDISWPSIPWPDISLPNIPWPDVTLPGWVEFLLDYTKVWVPLVAGVALAVVAVRHSRRSREIKRRWADRQRDEPSGCGPAGR